MKTNPGLLFFIIFILSFITSCNKNTCTAGSGGNVTINAFPQHHGVPVPNQLTYPDTVYVAFNTQESPGSDLSSYDTYFVGEPGESHVRLTGLRCGDYYMLAAGFDTTIHQRVTGGMPYSFSQKSGEINLNIPVTE